MGDSITYGGDWGEYFPDLSICKLAVPGDSIEQVLYRSDMAVKLQPKKIFVLVGVNNISRGNYKNTIKEKYNELIDALTVSGAEVYVQSILPVRSPSKVDNTRIDIVNEIICQIANEHNCTYIDINTVFSDKNGEIKQELTKDGIHLNETGYKKWVEEIKKFIQ